MSTAARQVQQELPVIEKQPSFAATVWQKLSRIDVGDHIETKGDRVKLSYLAWSWAWTTLMNHYPESDFDIGEEEVFPDGTQSANVQITVREGENELTRRMWLPVMDHTNKAIQNPNSRQVSDSRMRCMVKCLALFGLGTDLYAKSDIPVGSVDDPIDDYQIKTLSGLLEKLNHEQRVAFFNFVGCDGLVEITQGDYRKALSALERKVKAVKP